MPPSCAATSPTPRSARSMLLRRGRARAWSRSIPPPISAPIGRRGRFWCRRRRSPASSSISARRCRSPRTRCAMSASRWPSSWRESRYLAEDALADIVVELDPLPVVVDLEKALADTSLARARRCARQRRRSCPPEPRQLRRRPRARRTHHQPPLPLRSRRLLADRDARHRRQLGRARQSAHGLGHDAGAGVPAQRACRRCSA